MTESHYDLDLLFNIPRTTLFMQTFIIYLLNFKRTLYFLFVMQIRIPEDTSPPLRGSESWFRGVIARL